MSMVDPDDPYKGLNTGKQKKETEWPAVVGVLGVLIIIATTIILLVKL